MNNGIDYGMGLTNIDKATGIRFGVIHSNAVGEAWYESSVADYGDATCPVCGEDMATYDEDKHGAYGESSCFSDYACKSCEQIYDSSEAFGDEPLGHDYTGDGIVASAGESGDIFITKSPFYARASYCSPCAPGACYLENPSDDGEKAYCFPHNWFEGGKAPYRVFRVADGIEVMA